MVRRILMSLMVVSYFSMDSSLAQTMDGDDSASVDVSITVADSSGAKSLADTLAVLSDRVIAYYFHGNVRCGTCIKLEEYSQEALTAAFSEELGSGALVWRPVNFDEDENEHFIEDYQLYTKAVILSRMEGDIETGWMNLDKIWELVNDHDKYVTYVKIETQAFMNPKTDD